MSISSACWSRMAQMYMLRMIKVGRPYNLRSRRGYPVLSYRCCRNLGPLKNSMWYNFNVLAVVRHPMYCTIYQMRSASFFICSLHCAASRSNDWQILSTITYEAPYYCRPRPNIHRKVAAFVIYRVVQRSCIHSHEPSPFALEKLPPVPADAPQTQTQWRRGGSLAQPRNSTPRARSPVECTQHILLPGPANANAKREREVHWPLSSSHNAASKRRASWPLGKRRPQADQRPKRRG